VVFKSLFIKKAPTIVDALLLAREEASQRRVKISASPRFAGLVVLGSAKSFRLVAFVDAHLRPEGLPRFCPFESLNIVNLGIIKNHQISLVVF
jgi:hypothetical protein